jgi:hypothetical protein
VSLYAESWDIFELRSFYLSRRILIFIIYILEWINLLFYLVFIYSKYNIHNYSLGVILSFFFILNCYYSIFITSKKSTNFLFPSYNYLNFCSVLQTFLKKKFRMETRRSQRIKSMQKCSYGDSNAKSHAYKNINTRNSFMGTNINYLDLGTHTKLIKILK